MHVCKGLEFDHVYLPALNEGIIPGRRCREPEDFEEERRLLYVAMTSAKGSPGTALCDGHERKPQAALPFLVGLWDQKLCILIVIVIK